MLIFENITIYQNSLHSIVIYSLLLMFLNIFVKC